MEAKVPLIRIAHLKKAYGRQLLLKDVTLDIYKGEIFGLLGRNGEGKSTLLSILATIGKASSGKIMVKGLDYRSEKKQIRQLIGYVPQEIALWENFTVKENLHHWSKFVKVRPTEKQLMQLCEALTLRDKWNVKVSHLSGGMKRKLNIAVALIHNPDILLMDEPTVGIDLQSKLEINEYMRKLAESGKTIIYITHDIHEIIYLCDRIGVLSEGNLLFIGTLEEAGKVLDLKNGSNVKEEIVYHLLNQRKWNG